MDRLVRSELIQHDPTWEALVGVHYDERYDWVESLALAQPILDVGCGQGYQTVLLARQYGRVSGLDICPSLCQATADMARINGVEVLVYEGDAHAIPFDDGSYRTVTCFQMLEHLEDPQAVVDECARVLIKGGTLVADCPRYGTMGPDIFPGHKQDFTDREFIGMAHAAGLTLTRYHTTNLFQMMTAVKP
jgi:2-polyprenyl-3-methyl-5-hydroxy-6-metoxy-1,4-benzoquinol methylase